MGKENLHISKKELERLYLKEKMPMTKIARKFNCNHNSIAIKMKKYNIKPRTTSESVKLFVKEKKIDIPKKELISLFQEGVSLSKLSANYGCKIATVMNRLREAGIPVKISRGTKTNINKENLKDLYSKQKFTTYQIAEKYNCCQATIWKKLKQFGIKRRNPHELNSKVPSREKLIKLYINKKLSTWEIEKRYGYSRSTAYRKLKEYGIKVRTPAESHIIYPRKDFSGNLIEKAYLIGFRIGDLRVRKIWNGDTVKADCGSTKNEQIELIKNLFNEYGHVWISNQTKSGKIQVEVGLNSSFSFLLSKEVPEWIIDDKNYFFPFLAGFIDAEGHIGIYNNMARFSLGNYDFKVLGLIHSNLIKYKIICPELMFDKRKGKTNNKGYVYRSNYCSLRLHNKEELLKLFLKIKPYIKHKNKIKALKRAIENINNREIKKMTKNKNFQISTAIDYPSGRFHLGHAYEKICTDVIARWKRLNGFNVHFSTGTDCHGLKIQKAAEKAGKTPERFVNEISNDFRELCRVLNISYDDFIMTIEKRHEKTVINILNKLEKKGYIYKGDYEGLYCVDCETFYTEKDLVNRECPFHSGKRLEKLKEETYFFKLSEFQKRLKDAIQNNDLIWPKKKKNEILNRLQEPLKDLSISRANVNWGIPLPFDKKKTIAVWNDALINYLSTVDYPNKKFKDFWPAVHIIGSDIVWHHTILWYSMLFALDIKLPKVIVHGFVNLEGEKLSKAKGITIDPIDLSEKYGADSLRYFLIRNIPFGEDGDFSEKVLIERHNNELANKLGNLVSRVTALAEKNGIEKAENKLLKKLKLKEIEKLFENYELDKALNLIFEFIDVCNEYVQNKKPWETKDRRVLYELVDSIKAIAILLWPFMPETCEKIAKLFDFEIKFDETEKPLKVKKIKKSEILFRKI